MFSYAMLAGMIIISLLFFRDLGIKKVAGFNGAFIGTFFLPLVKIPSIAALVVQLLIVTTYFAIAKST